MLAGISGTVVSVEGNTLIIRAGAFRFSVACPLPVLSQALPQSEIELCTYLHVREDELSLYGFAEQADLNLFKLLISVSGIGPKSGLEILGAGGDAVRSAIVSEDVKFLTSIKGIGKRTAERAIIELREKIGAAGDVAEGLPGRPHVPHIEEALAALTGLGWKPAEIKKRLEKAPESLKDTETLIRWFLTNS